MLNHKRFSLLLLVASLLIATSALAGERPSPMSFLKENTAKVLELVHQNPGADKRAERDQALRTLVGSFIDYDDLAARSLGKHWAERTEEEKIEYKALFREIVELSYVDKLNSNSDEPDYVVEWEEESQSGDQGSAICFVLYEDTETEIEFVLKGKGEGWLIQNLLLDGASLEQTYQKKYGKIIDKEGYDKLVVKMKERLEKLRAKAAK